MPNPDLIDPLVRAVYGLGWLKRDMMRRTGFDPSIALPPLAMVHRLGTPRVKDVADALHVDLSVASRQLSALVDAGYVERSPAPDDRRSQIVTVTPAGQAALERAHAGIVQAFESALAGWTDAEITALTAATERLREDYRRAVVERADPAVTA